MTELVTEQAIELADARAAAAAQCANAAAYLATRYLAEALRLALVRFVQLHPDVIAIDLQSDYGSDDEGAFQVISLQAQVTPGSVDDTFTIDSELDQIDIGSNEACLSLFSGSDGWDGSLTRDELLALPNQVQH